MAVLINQDSLPDGEMTLEKEKEIENLIFAATGLDTKQVEVRSERFNKQSLDGDTIEDKGINWMLIGGLIAVIIIMGIVALIYYRRKAKLAQEEEDQLDRLLLEKSLALTEEIEDLDFEAEESKMKAQIDKFIDNKPESVAQLLRNWLNE